MDQSREWHAPVFTPMTDIGRKAAPLPVLSRADARRKAYFEHGCGGEQRSPNCNPLSLVIK